MHPHVLDPKLCALVHRLVGDLRPGSDHDRLDPAGDRAQVVVGAIAFHLVGVGVDGEDLVAAVAQALVYDVAAVVFGIPGDAGYCDSPVTQKLRCRFLDRCHGKAPSRTGFNHFAFVSGGRNTSVS